MLNQPSPAVCFAALKTNSKFVAQAHLQFDPGCDVGRKLQPHVLTLLGQMPHAPVAACNDDASARHRQAAKCCCWCWCCWCWCCWCCCCKMAYLPTWCDCNTCPGGARRGLAGLMPKPASQQATSHSPPMPPSILQWCFVVRILLSDASSPCNRQGGCRLRSQSSCQASNRPSDGSHDPSTSCIARASDVEHSIWLDARSWSVLLCLKRGWPGSTKPTQACRSLPILQRERTCVNDLYGSLGCVLHL